MVIRVPQGMAKELLKIARRLDTSPSFRVREEPSAVVLELGQARRVRYTSEKPVNVSSVPHRSPFRYPGGKTWLVPYIRDWLRSKQRPPAHLIEPFAGGAIVSMTAAFERLAKHVIFCELDDAVASVWKVVLNGHAEWLTKQILTFDVDVENVRRVLANSTSDLRERAFQTILRNRVQRGGIMAAGASLMKDGEKGRGLKSRWYPQTLARRIREINRLKDKLTFVQGDGFALIEEHQADRDAVFYIDPPYTITARRLYTKWKIDHSRLFSLMRDCKGDFIMSYNNTAEITGLAKKYGFETCPIAMKSTHHAKMTELLLGRGFSWMRNGE